MAILGDVARKDGAPELRVRTRFVYLVLIIAFLGIMSRLAVLQIAQGDASPLQIEMSRQRPGDVRELHGDPTREPRHDGGEQAHAQPLQLVTERFPG